MDKIYTIVVVLSFGVGLFHCADVPIYIGAFIELNTTNGGWNSAGIWPAVELAKSHINQQNDVLKGIKLHVDMKDSKCSTAYAIKSLVDHITSNNTKIALIGPGCSISSQPVAEAAVFWNLVQVSYGAGTARLSDKTKYPLFYRVNSPETLTNLAIVALILRFNWRKVAIVKEDVMIYHDVYEHLHDLLRSNNITVISMNSFVEDPTNAVRDLQDNDARIMIALTYEDKCRRLLCAAYKQGFYGNHLVWLLRGWYIHKWWNMSDTECTGHEIRVAMGNYISIEEKILSTDDIKAVSGRTPSQLQSLYLEKAKKMSLPVNSYAPYGYDVLWLVALALNHSMPILAKVNKTLADFDYQSRDMTALFNSSIANISFMGMSGKVEFDKNCERVNQLWIEQFQGDDEVKIGRFDTKEGKPNVDSITLHGSFVWQGGKIPKSEPDIIETMEKIDPKLYIAMAALECIGICMALGFLGFNITYRNNSYIRMSSPHLNNLIIIGSLMCYVCVFLHGSAAFLTKTQTSIYRIMCIIRLWLLSCGFTLAFGTMFVKTWRVYKIFTNNKLNKELGYLRDRHLVILVVLFLCIDIVILTTWQIIDPLRTTVDRLSNKTSDTSKIYYTTAFICTSVHQTAWTASLYSYKALLLLFGLFLAWETRNITLRAINDSRYIGMSVYNVVIWACITVPLSEWVTKNSVNGHFGLLASAINICTTSTLLLVFGPKVWSVKVTVTDTSTVTDTKTTPEQTRRTKQHPVCPGCKCE